MLCIPYNEVKYLEANASLAKFCRASYQEECQGQHRKQTYPCS